MKAHNSNNKERELSLFPLPETPSNSKGLEAMKGRGLPSKRDVAYVELGCKTVLNHCNTDRMPDVWTVNPYRGCEFACGYCYARYTHEFLGFEGGEGFERTIFVKVDAGSVLASTVKPETLYQRPIAIGTATDPYQPAEKRYGVTRSILEVLSRYPGLSISIVTKSPLITCDLELLKEIDSASRLTIMVSLSTLSDKVLSVFDPRAPSAGERLRTIQALSRRGLHVGVHCAPVLPGITDDSAGLEALCRAARDHGARFMGAEVLFMTASIRARFWPLLVAHFPEQKALYRKLFSGGVDAPRHYQRQVYGLIEKLRARYGLVDRRPRATGLYKPEPLQPAAEQLTLGVVG